MSNYRVLTFRETTRGSGMQVAGQEIILCPRHYTRLRSEVVILRMTEDACHRCDAEFANRVRVMAQENQAWMNPRVIPESSTVYIAGPMSGLPENNCPAFFMMEHNLKVTCGCSVLNPAREEQGLPYKELVARGIRNLLTASHVVMLRGWNNSQGALIEQSLAMLTEKVIIYETE